jgi:hypothetical protein
MLRMKLGMFYRQNEIDKNATFFIVNLQSYSQAGRFECRIVERELIGKDEVDNSVQ